MSQTASDATADTSYEDYENETLRRMEEAARRRKPRESICSVKQINVMRTGKPSITSWANINRSLFG